MLRVMAPSPLRSRDNLSIATMVPHPEFWKCRRAEMSECHDSAGGSGRLGVRSVNPGWAARCRLGRAFRRSPAKRSSLMNNAVAGWSGRPSRQEPHRSGRYGGRRANVSGLQDDQPEWRHPRPILAARHGDGTHIRCKAHGVHPGVHVGSCAPAASNPISAKRRRGISITKWFSRAWRS